jgi:hypothetical protein
MAENGPATSAGGAPVMRTRPVYGLRHSAGISASGILNPVKWAAPVLSPPISMSISGMALGASTSLTWATEAEASCVESTRKNTSVCL